MAILYVRSTDGSDADNGSTWALAKATIAGALAAASAGDTVYVSHVHAETGSGTLASAGTAASPIKIICVNDGAEPPTAIASTATHTASTFIFTGFAIYCGISFTATSGSGSLTTITCVNNNASGGLFFDSCVFSLGTGATQFYTLGSRANSGTDDQSVYFRDCTFRFQAVGQYIAPVGLNHFTTCIFADTGSVPTTLLKPLASGMCDVLIHGSDLGTLGSGKNLADLSTASASGRIAFHNCKLGASISFATGSITSPGGLRLDVVNCDSGDTNYRYGKHRFEGVITSETTIVRTGGASDGTTPISRKMVSSANSNFCLPLESDPSVVWNESTSSLTVTIAIVTDNVTLTDAECWVEVEELGTSGYPLSVIQSDRAADILATPANQSTDTSTWTTTGLTTPVYQKLSVTFTPAEKGALRAVVMLAKPSTTIYYCPKLEVS